MKDTQARIDVLTSQHKELEKRLIMAEKTYATDGEVALIKKEKLKIKDTIAYLQRELADG